ncbi:MAG: outer membrane beta-barrel protein [Hymenobacter sp.]
MLSTFRNAGTEQAYGTNLFVGINNAKMSINGSVDVFYNVLRNNDPNAIYNSKNQGFVVNGRVFGAYNLNKEWALQAFAFVRGQQVQLQGNQSGFGIYSLSLQRNFAEKRGNIGFGMENFFSNKITIRNSVSTPYVDSLRWRAPINGPVLTQNSTNVLNRLSFKINFSYRIGKLTVDQRARPQGREQRRPERRRRRRQAAASIRAAAAARPAVAAAVPRPVVAAPAGAGARPGGYPGAGQRPAGAGRPASATDSTRRAIPADSLQQLRNPAGPPAGAMGRPASATPGVAVPAYPADGTTPSASRLAGREAYFRTFAGGCALAGHYFAGRDHARWQPRRPALM